MKMMKPTSTCASVITISFFVAIVGAVIESSPGTQLAKHMFEDAVNGRTIDIDGQASKYTKSIEPQAAQSTMVKRSAARPYSFGLGKKSMPLSLEDILSDSRLRNELIRQQAELILSNEPIPRSDMYFDDASNDLDASSMEAQRASDKRSNAPIVRNMIGGKPGMMSYSFGLGKRSNWMGKISALPEPAYLGDIKRRYSFGLGK